MRYYPHPACSGNAMTATLGDSSDDCMVIAGVKWLHKLTILEGGI